MESSTELKDTFLKVAMLCVCGLTLWKKPENLEKNANLGWIDTTISHTDVGI